MWGDASFVRGERLGLGLQVEMRVGMQLGGLVHRLSRAAVLRLPRGDGYEMQIIVNREGTTGYGKCRQQTRHCAGFYR